MPCGCIKSLSRTDIKHKSIYIFLSMPKFYSWYLTHGPLWHHMSHMKNNNKRNKTKQKYGYGNGLLLDGIKLLHHDVIKWKHFPRYWPLVWGIHRSPVNSPHKGQWRGALMFSLICAWIKGWVNNGEAGDLRRYRAHYDVTVMNCTNHDALCSSASSHYFTQCWLIVKWTTGNEFQWN